MTPSIELLTTLTLKQKADLLSGSTFWESFPIDDAGVPAITLSDGPHGVRKQDGDADHLGINAAVPATAFPTASATACSWDRELLGEIGRALSAEARSIGVHVLLGPGVNIKRSPLCGRNFEYFSEDPLLSGELGAAWVRGLQEAGVGASVKHFAANNQETDRMRVSAEVDERTMREIYLRAFERIVRTAAPATVMASYNRINGTFAAQNPWLLSDVLRGEWGYEGAVVSDWGAVSDPVASVRAGLDLQMPSTRGAADAIVAAVAAGDLDESVVNRAAERVLRLVERVADAEREGFSPETHHALARRAAAESAVLLKNEGALPLTPTRGGRIVVIGEFARAPRYQGAGSSHINPTRLDTALDAIREQAHDREVVFEAGFRIDGAPDAALASAAIAAVRSAEDVVVFLGLPDLDESEGFDRSRIDLPTVQTELLAWLAQAHPRVVVVLSNGGVVSIAPWQRHASAVLEMWLGGQAAGSAAADLLFGRVNPSGKLAETIPLSLADTPVFLNFPGDGKRVLYGERIYVGYRYYDTVDRSVDYAFGYGISYTSFAYEHLAVEVVEESLLFHVTIRNTGSHDGAEIVQFYAGAPSSGVDRPAQELIGFHKLFLPAGSAQRITVPISLNELNYYSVEHSAWVRSGGKYTFTAAASSRDHRDSVTVRLNSTEPAPQLTMDTPVGVWLGHEEALMALNRLFLELTGSALQDFDADTLALVNPLPLSNFLAMSMGGQGFELPQERVAQLLEEVSERGA